MFRLDATSWILRKAVSKETLLYTEVVSMECITCTGSLRQKTWKATSAATERWGYECELGKMRSPCKFLRWGRGGGVFYSTHLWCFSGRLSWMGLWFVPVRAFHAAINHSTGACGDTSHWRRSRGWITAVDVVWGLEVMGHACSNGEW